MIERKAIEMTIFGRRYRLSVEAENDQEEEEMADGWLDIKGELVLLEGEGSPRTVGTLSAFFDPDEPEPYRRPTDGVDRDEFRKLLRGGGR